MQWKELFPRIVVDRTLTIGSHAYTPICVLSDAGYEVLLGMVWNVTKTPQTYFLESVVNAFGDALYLEILKTIEIIRQWWRQTWLWKRFVLCWKSWQQRDSKCFSLFQGEEWRSWTSCKTIEWHEPWKTIRRVDLHFDLNFQANCNRSFVEHSTEFEERSKLLYPALYQM